MAPSLNKTNQEALARERARSHVRITATGDLLPFSVPRFSLMGGFVPPVLTLGRSAWCSDFARCFPPDTRSFSPDLGLCLFGSARLYPFYLVII